MSPHYWVTDFASAAHLLTLPYYYHFDDQFFLLFPRKGTGLENPDALLRNWKAELDAQYKRGRQFAMVLHPHAIGWPNRLHVLEQLPRPCRRPAAAVERHQRRLRARTGRRPSRRPRISGSSRRSGATIPAA